MIGQPGNQIMELIGLAYPGHGWRSELVQLIDEQDAPIDLSKTDFKCAVKLEDRDGRLLASLSRDSGGIVLTSDDDGPGFTCEFSPEALTAIGDGLYVVRIETVTDGEPKDIVAGYLQIGAIARPHLYKQGA